MEFSIYVLKLKEFSQGMKERTVDPYRRILFLVEIIFALLLILNGVILILNLFGLFSFQQAFPGFSSIDSLFKWSAHEWRFFIENMYTLVTSHLAAFVMICLGIVIASAAIHTKKSL